MRMPRRSDRRRFERDPRRFWVAPKDNGSTLSMRHCAETLGWNLAAVSRKTVHFSDIAVLIVDFVKNGQSIFRLNLACETTEKSDFDANHLTQTPVRDQHEHFH